MYDEGGGNRLLPSSDQDTALRYAVYFTPAETDPLTRDAARWLGRDAFSGDEYSLPAVTGIEPEELAALTADPRRYGFHATLKAPFTLASGATETELVATFEAFCASRKAVSIPRVVLGQIGDFFAIVPDQVYPGLQSFAGDVVRAFEPFRAPLNADDIARRKPEKLGDAERCNLDGWGYPYVFDEFRFHMTLTGRVPAALQENFRAALQARFAGHVDRPLSISGLALFREETRGAPFTVQSWLPLGATPEPKA